MADSCQFQHGLLICKSASHLFLYSILILLHIVCAYIIHGPHTIGFISRVCILGRGCSYNISYCSPAILVSRHECRALRLRCAHCIGYGIVYVIKYNITATSRHHSLPMLCRSLLGLCEHFHVGPCGIHSTTYIAGQLR